MAHEWRRRILIVACLATACFCAPPLTAQGTQAPQASSPAPASPAPASPAPAAAPQASAATPAPQAGAATPDADLVLATLPLDISTSTFDELTNWARSLGLSDSGSSAELRSRLYDYYHVKAPAGAQGGRTITIEHAGTAEYFKLDSSKSPIVRVSGGVVLTLSDEAKGESQRLEADQIVYDRERNAVTAMGHVHYHREGPQGVEEFSGETMNADLDDWSGLFLDGKMRRTGAGAATAQKTPAAQAAASTTTSTPASPGPSTAPSGAPTERAFTFEADTILKRTGNLLVLDNGMITASDAEHPYYSIRAKRLWLLGDNEWAIADAVLSVGEVPLLWLPFFYYPGEEIVFHPVLGFQSRAGTFMQTTTYLIGSKSAAQGTSILSFAQSSSGEQKELHGVFLKPIEGTTAKADTGATLKLLADVYTNLGAYAGLTGNFPKSGILDKLNFTAGVGVSRSLFATANGYSPYTSDSNWTSIWNNSQFFGAGIPLRYGLDFSAGLSFGGLSMSLALPFYSDSYFNNDFANRSEDMDWINLSNGTSTSPTSSTSSSTTTSSTTTTATVINSFTQTFQASYTLKPAALSPWLSSVELSHLSASIAWLSQTNTTLYNLYNSENSLPLFAVDPAQYFFYPSLTRPLDAAVTLKGSLLPGAAPNPGAGASSAVGAASAAGAASAPAAGAPAAGSKNTGLDLQSPWDAEQDGSAAGTPGGATDSTSASGGDFKLTGRAPSFPAAPASATNGGFSLDWQLSPSAYIEDRYLSDLWNGPADVDFSDFLYQLYSYRVASSLQAGFAPPNGAVSGSLGLSWTSQDQTRTTTDNSNYNSLVSSYLLTDYQYRLSQLGSAFKAQVKPFNDIYLLSPTALSYDLEGNLFQYAYSGLDSRNNPVYQTLGPAWNSTMVTINTAAATLGLRTGAQTQTLMLTFSLPPTTEAYAATLNLAAGSGDWGAAFSSTDRMYRAAVGSPFLFDPLSVTASLNAPLGLKLADTATYDWTLGGFKTNMATFAWGPFSAGLGATYDYTYAPALGTGWQAIGSQFFQLSSAKVAYHQEFKFPDGAPYSGSFIIDSSYAQNLLQFTDSVISLGLSLKFRLANWLDLSFTSLSQNSDAWRYWPWLFPAVSSLGNPSDFYRNPFEDIWDSFSFWDTAARTASFFKLKSISVSLVHDLHDWDLSFTLTASPVLDTTTMAYTLSPSFSVMVRWRDVPDIKASVSKDTSGYTF
jgi:hypothetical protein